MVHPNTRIDRRAALGLLGGAGMLAVLNACGSSSKARSRSASSTFPSTPAATSTTNTNATQVGCVLAPEVTEGPFYLDLNKVRRDITEGRDGAPLALTISVVDATTCKAFKEAVVDIWHCDAGGVYSGFDQSPGTEFLRGTQLTAADGGATFQTIYPGWYPGRAVHIHMKVHNGGNVVHTGQLFFDDAQTEAVYTRSPYSGKGAPDTPNANDSIYNEAGAAAIADVKAKGDGYAATLTVGVQPS
jgi:protocatechuate 3,4-dioxygenase beta subunit